MPRTQPQLQVAADDSVRIHRTPPGYGKVINALAVSDDQKLADALPSHVHQGRVIGDPLQLKSKPISGSI